MATTHPAAGWHRRRTHHHSRFGLERVRAAKDRTVSVCLPARDEAATIGPILAALDPLRDAGVVDQVVVVSQSSDGTDEIARAAGAEVFVQDALLAELGPAVGKGDAMWRALSVLRGDLVLFADADSGRFGAHFVLGTVGPLLCEPGVAFVKGFFRRPFRAGATSTAEGGGRVSELTARPLLNRFCPALAGFVQPLAGEVAAPRGLLMRLPFACGYAVETAMLIDVWRAVGLDGLAQVDLDVRENRHQPLADLAPMAAAVLAAVTTRLERDGRLTPTGDEGLLVPLPGGELVDRAPALLERPPMASLVAEALGA